MKTRAQKEELSLKLEEKLGRAKAVVFTDYKGLTMQQLSDLRNKLADVSGEFSITKNTALIHALKNTDHKLPESNFEGPTATLFAYNDEISPIKLLVKTLKDASMGKVKGGLLGTDVLDVDKINQLATLPTKDELRGKTVSVLAAPLQGMVGVLNANLRNLVYALDQLRLNRSQIRISKGGV